MVAGPGKKPVAVVQITTVNPVGLHEGYFRQGWEPEEGRKHRRAQRGGTEQEQRPAVWLPEPQTADPCRGDKGA